MCIGDSTHLVGSAQEEVVTSSHCVSKDRSRSERVLETLNENHLHLGSWLLDKNIWSQHYYRLSFHCSK